MTTTDDAARAARMRYPDPWGDHDPYNDGGLSHSQREAYIQGRADERAQIAARRDEVAEVPREVRALLREWESTPALRRGAAARELRAALGVSDR